MTTLTATSFLKANLESLGRRNAQLAERLASIEPAVDLSFADSADGVPSAAVAGRQLCSKVRPLEEARRLVDPIDLVEHAVVVVLGFGAGWHVKRLAERSLKSTLLVVYEPDLALLRSVFEHIDHSAWMRDALIVVLTDADDRAALGTALNGAESILGQGVHVLEHPASRMRLGDQAARFTRIFSEHVDAARTTLSTTLMRSVDTVRNLLRNIDHYAGGAGVAELEGAAAGFPAVIVSAGPSLHRNMHLLRDPNVRDRCVIIAVQTALRPLLSAGITPHFVTALDYHEISRRFYEELDADMLREVTLVADPKVHPVVVDVYPGPVRMCSNGFLDKALGDAARPMGDLPAGATVAHLAMYLARHLGCDPVAMIGQDLGFPDGLYYAPGAAIHDTWAPELNPFNTIAMMEWQRITRHRTHLRRTHDVHGRSIFTDAQMHTYLQQFERDFAGYALRGWTTIDASEGGVRKQNAASMPLRDFLHAHATTPLPPWPTPPAAIDRARLSACGEALAHKQRDIARLRDLSRDTADALQRMLADQKNARRMNTHFQRVEANRQAVEKLMSAFDLLNVVNQMGTFRRMKADRRLHMSQGLDAMTVQRHQIERDLENVRWLADAADDLLGQLDESQALLRGEAYARPASNCDVKTTPIAQVIASPSRIAALVPVDPHRNGLGLPRSLASDFDGRTVLQATLERLAHSQTIESIILIAPEDFDIDSLLDRHRLRMPVEVERCAGASPFGVEHEAIAVARLFSDTCWRGGIAGMSIYDETLCPQVMSAVMAKRGLTAGLICGPDWPRINVVDEGGCDAVVRRHLERPDQHNLVFTQSPPGLCGCVVSAKLMAELAQRNRLSTIGGLLIYQPHAPQHDPIARDACVQTPHAIRRSLGRATFDTARWREAMRASADLDHACEIAAARGPQHVVLELNTERISRGIFARSLGAASPQRAAIDFDSARRLLDGLAATAADEVVLTLHGLGDPLLHSRFDDLIRAAKSSGIRAVNVRTELLVDHAFIDRLLASGVDVVSVDLNADRAVTYMAMMGCDRFKDALLNIEHLINHRRRLTSQTGSAAIALPWVVPHLQRRAETYEDIDTFFDRWMHMLGTAVIDDPPSHSDPRPIGLTPAVTPPRVLQREALRRMTFLSDGSVPLRDMDFSGSNCIGDMHKQSPSDLWRDLRAARQAVTQERES